MHVGLLALFLKVWSTLNASGSLASLSFDSNSLSDSSLFLASSFQSQCPHALGFL